MQCDNVSSLTATLRRPVRTRRALSDRSYSLRAVLTCRPHTWSGIFQKLIPSRPAPQVPPNRHLESSTLPLTDVYAEISKPQPSNFDDGANLYSLAEEIPNSFVNLAGKNIVLFTFAPSYEIHFNIIC